MILILIKWSDHFRWSWSLILLKWHWSFGIWRSFEAWSNQAKFSVKGNFVKIFIVWNWPPVPTNHSYHFQHWGVTCPLLDQITHTVLSMLNWRNLGNFVILIFDLDLWSFGVCDLDLFVFDLDHFEWYLIFDLRSKLVIFQYSVPGAVGKKTVI